MLEQKRCVIYARVASVGHDSQELLAEQIRIAQNHLDTLTPDGATRVYIDRGISGTSVDRPGLDALMSDVADDQIDLIVCSSTDRIGRGETGELLLAQLYDMGVDFEAADKATAFRHDMMMRRLLLTR